MELIYENGQCHAEEVCSVDLCTRSGVEKEVDLPFRYRERFRLDKKVGSTISAMICISGLMHRFFASEIAWGMPLTPLILVEALIAFISFTCCKKGSI